MSKRENITVYNGLKTPFSLHGLISPDLESGLLHRIPKAVAQSTNEGVVFHNTNTAGGRIRFKTNSSYIGIQASLGNVCRMPHFALAGCAGFDLYSGLEHITTFQPQYDISDSLFGEVELHSKEMTEYTINFPLYSEVREVNIILDKETELLSAEPYKYEKPVVFYGSSITQGGCASHSGTAYTEILSRRLGFDYINLGFSGSAKGEKEIADYISGLDMSVFVLDYDYNAPTAEHLEATHEAFFNIVREKQPDIPIICLTMPLINSEAQKKRREIIEKTVTNAINNGDKNAYYIDVSSYLFERNVSNEASVDRCHPNDLGFYFMAEAVENTLKNALSEN